jgi:prevent-host-death family protein
MPPLAVFARGASQALPASFMIRLSPLSKALSDRISLMKIIESDNVQDQITLIPEIAMGTASVTDVARNFAEYLNRVAYHGESFTLTRGGKPVAELVPVPRGVRVQDLPAIFASLPKLSAEELDAFAADIEAGRPKASDDDFRDPWAS